MLDTSTDQEPAVWGELGRLASVEPGTSPFPTYQQQVFDAASAADVHATRTLKVLWIPVVALSCGAFFALAVFPDVTVTANLAIVALLASFVSIVSQMLAYYATGWAPHMASQAANRAQDMQGVLTRLFYEYAAFLVTAFLSGTERDRLRASLLARAINVWLLRERVFICSFGSSGDVIVNPLEDAVRFINHSLLEEQKGTDVTRIDVHDLSFRTVAVRHLVDSILSKRALAALAQRVADLENKPAASIH